MATRTGRTRADHLCNNASVGRGCGGAAGVGDRLRAVAVGALGVGAMAGAAGAQYDYKDWTPTFSTSAWTYANTSSAGTVTGISSHPGFAAQPGTWGVPLAITNQAPMTCEFQIHGTAGLGNSLDLSFSSGYAWGSGGRLLLGNIHNYYEYTLSAWDQSNTQIDVNTWTTLAEYPSTAPGTIGYFSTSTTTRTASGLSSVFSVFDTSVNANLGQGGVVSIGGLVNVGKIRLTLTNSALAPNGQQVDFILFNVATPVPGPGAGAVAGLGALVLGGRRRRASGR